MTASSEQHEQFLKLYVEHQRRIYGYIFTMVANHSDAEDLLSETSLTLWRKFDEFEPGTNFVAWACRVAHYKVLNHLKSQAKSEFQLSEGVLSKLTDARLDRDDLQTRMRSALPYCLQRLSEGDYHLIKLCYYGASSIKDVATKLGRSSGSVYKSLHRIRGALMQCVERRLRVEEADQ